MIDEAVSKRCRNNRRRGHSFERLIANMFKAIFPKAARLLEYQEGFGVDIMNTGVYDIQCKRLKKYASITKIEEVPAVIGRIPILITKGDNKPIMAVLPLEHLLELIKNNQGILYANN